MIDNNNNNNDKNNSNERPNSTVFLQSPHCAAKSPTCTLKWLWSNRAQITCNTSSAYHVQRAVCHLVRRDSSAVKFDRVEKAFILAFYFYWLKPLTNEGGGKAEYPGGKKKNKTTSFSLFQIVQLHDIFCYLILQ